MPSLFRALYTYNPSTPPHSLNIGIQCYQFLENWHSDISHIAAPNTTHQSSFVSTFEIKEIDFLSFAHKPHTFYDFIHQHLSMFCIHLQETPIPFAKTRSNISNGYSRIHSKYFSFLAF